ncbi:MAG: DUF1905 domain-containing protein [Saprospiraceae bacterium]|nr:DUF1905 domain-containing protein [Saprospiraceae bacterium]
MSIKIKISKALEKFDSKGEKTGWTYIYLEKELSDQIAPEIKISYRVFVRIDQALEPLIMTTLPMGKGNFIIPIKSEVLKKIRKKAGDIVQLEISMNLNKYEIDSDFREFLESDQKAIMHFNSLTRSHQNYFSKWIESAKTETTKANRIAEAIQALAKKMSYSEMLNARKKNN